MSNTRDKYYKEYFYYVLCIKVFIFFRDPSKEALLEHVREHSRADNNQDEIKPVKKPENPPDPADLAYRCGHCNQLSNWKHVIQVNNLQVSIFF
jgi:hypothetical protein